jgi:cytochrome c
MRLTIGMTAALVALGMGHAAWAQDVAQGEKLFKQVCFTCHTAEAGKNKIGPSLFGVVGRKAGSVAEFSYSSAMKDSNVTWDEEALDKYLTDPRKFVAGNKMAYVGLKKPEQRAEVIAYLKTLH